MHTSLTGFAHDLVCYVPSSRILREGGGHEVGIPWSSGLPAMEWADDIEAYWRGATNASLCQRCRERFQSEKFKDWDEYLAAMGREIHVEMKNAIDKSLADARIKHRIVYGSYRTEPITPLNDGLFAFNNTYPDLLQMAMPSLYVAGDPLAVAESISVQSDLSGRIVSYPIPRPTDSLSPFSSSALCIEM